MPVWKNFINMMKDLTVRPEDVKVARKPPEETVVKDQDAPLSASKIKEILGKSSDVIFREFFIAGEEDIHVMLAVIDGMIDKIYLDQFILRVLMVDLPQNPKIKTLTEKNILEECERNFLPGVELKTVEKVEEAYTAVLSGDAVLFFGETPKALVVGARGWPNRGVAEPETEAVVRGPREGFSETLRINTTLLRRKLKHPSLRLLSMTIGDITNTNVVVTYLEGIAAPDMVSEVLKRLKKIKIDGVLESAYLEEMIEDVPYSPFPQISYTERPDVMAAGLLEGKVGILVDGTPIGLMVPVVLSDFFQVSEDYYERTMIVILVRMVRYIGAVISILAPSIYIAVTTFHHEILPTALALSIAAGRDGVPFPALAEAVVMTVILEILQEAGLRLPKPIGSTIGIVGALVIGDAAVKASLVSPFMVIIVGITAVSSYAIPSYDLAIGIRLVRFPLILLSGMLGFYGIAFGLYTLLIHLVSLRSFGVPYLSPLAPFHLRTFLQDTFVRAPWWALKRRPDFIDVAEPHSRRKK